MGRKEYGLKKLVIEKFDKGFFPNKDFDDVPNEGSPDCKHVLTRRSRLRPFPGMDLVNAAQAGFLTGQGTHFLDVNAGTRNLVVFGQNIYSEDLGVLTDVTDTVTIGNGNLIQFVDHQQGADEYAICAQGGTGAPFKIGQTGNASLLGGNPPNFETIGKYHDNIFGSVKELLYFDNGGPELWDTKNNVIPFEKDIKCALEHGPKYAVLMEDHIGSVQGFDFLDFVAEEKEIRTVGCLGKQCAVNANFGPSDLKVIVTLSKDGIWVVDEAFSARRILGEDFFTGFNRSAFSKASMAYWRDENLLFVALPKDASTEPDYLIVINMKTGAFWPGPKIHGNFIRGMSSYRDANGKEYVQFQDNNGYLYRFNFDTIDYHDGTTTEEIDYRWSSKKFDLDDIHSFGQAVMLADAVGDWGINVAINFGLGIGDGTTGSINFNNESDVLGQTFVLGASTLGGSNYVFKPLIGVGGFGRFLQVTITRQGTEANDLLGSTFVLGQSKLGSASSFRLSKLELHLHRRRAGGDDQ
jgi:hypothetical protein